MLKLLAACSGDDGTLTGDPFAVGRSSFDRVGSGGNLRRLSSNNLSGGIPGTFGSRSFLGHIAEDTPPGDYVMRIRIPPSPDDTVAISFCANRASCLGHCSSPNSVANRQADCSVEVCNNPAVVLIRMSRGLTSNQAKVVCGMCALMKMKPYRVPLFYRRFYRHGSDCMDSSRCTVIGNVLKP